MNEQQGGADITTHILGLLLALRDKHMNEQQGGADITTHILGLLLTLRDKHE